MHRSDRLSRMLGERYEIESQIGQGASSVVWRGRDTRLDRAVAVKRLLPHLAADPVAAARFEREARTAAALNHPGLVTVYDSGADQDGPWIAMELVDGETVAAALTRTGRFGFERAASIGIQVARALDHAHQVGIVHRDIKPANIMLRSDGRVQVVDLGITTGLDTDSRLTSTGMVLGSLTYLAPEMASGSPASAVSDIYALGVVIFEMVTGTAPFPGGTLAEVIMAHQAVTPPSLGPLAPAWLDQVVVRCLAKNPVDRFASMAEMASALAAGGRPTAETTEIRAGTETAVMMTAPIPESKPEPRHRTGWVFGLLGALGLALVVLAVEGPKPVAAPLPATTPTTAQATTTDMTTTPITIASTTVTTLPVPTTPDDLVSSIVAEIESVLAAPQVKSKTARELSDKIDEAVDSWHNDDLAKAADQLTDAFSLSDRIDVRSVRDLVDDGLRALAEAMGFTVRTR